MKMLVNIHDYHRLQEIETSLLLSNLATHPVQAKKHLLDAIALVDSTVTEDKPDPERGVVYTPPKRVKKASGWITAKQVR